MRWLVCPADEAAGLFDKCYGVSLAALSWLAL